MHVRSLAIAAALAVAACARQPQQAAPAAQQSAAVEPSPQQLAQIKVEKFEVSPQPAKSGAPVTIHVNVADAPAGTTLTLSWFGPNGWLVTDMMSEAPGGAASFEIPASALPEAGRYRAVLRSGVVHMADTVVEVTG